MKEIKDMTEEIKGKQAAYRIQEEKRRECGSSIISVICSCDEDP